MNKQFLKNIFTSNSSISSLVLRVPVGIILTAHGAQKLFAWFGGYGLEGTGQWMESIGLAPGFLMAPLIQFASSKSFIGKRFVSFIITAPE